MEVTGRAFEDMQEQNKRLIDQLKEKDNANFKLMAERIKANQIQRLLQEEKEVLAEQVMTLQQQVTSQVQVVRRLEDKEMHLMNSYHSIEKEAQLRTQMAETLKKKVCKIIIDNSFTRKKKKRESLRGKTDVFAAMSFTGNRKHTNCFRARFAAGKVVSKLWWRQESSAWKGWRAAGGRISSQTQRGTVLFSGSLFIWSWYRYFVFWFMEMNLLIGWNGPLETKTGATKAEQCYRSGWRSFERRNTHVQGKCWCNHTYFVRYFHFLCGIFGY